jgi:dTDP-4-amino-4,6-dideoxygalactose transaminase
VVDCDPTGLIDLPALEALGRHHYDGIVATNPFAILGEMNSVVTFARQNGKALILDNAAAFVGFDRLYHHGVFECLSFHQTKPYGFGEGGCLIVDRAFEEDAKSAMDFGYRWSWSGGQPALSNGKLSDPAAAFILTRHREDAIWAQAYNEQFRRVLDIGERCGFRLLVDRDAVGPGVHGNVPLLCPYPVPLDVLQNETLVLQKYYKTLGDGQTSRDIYSRIVNVPCHPGVASLANSTIENLLSRIHKTAIERSRGRN